MPARLQTSIGLPRPCRTPATHILYGAIFMAYRINAMDRHISMAEETEKTKSIFTQHSKPRSHGVELRRESRHLFTSEQQTSEVGSNEPLTWLQSWAQTLSVETGGIQRVTEDQRRDNTTHVRNACTFWYGCPRRLRTIWEPDNQKVERQHGSGYNEYRHGRPQHGSRFLGQLRDHRRREPFRLLVASVDCNFWADRSEDDQLLVRSSPLQCTWPMTDLS